MDFLHSQSVNSALAAGLALTVPSWLQIPSGLDPRQVT